MPKEGADLHLYVFVLLSAKGLKGVGLRELLRGA